MPFKILRGDITKVKADAIVNAANENLWEGGGVCGAIFAEAGSEALAAECGHIGHCDTGSAVITSACGLKTARYIIHAVGPVWRGGVYGEESLLRSCYTKALELAAEHGCESIAFPLISTGIYGYPRDAAFDVAISAIRGFLETHEIDVSLVLFDRSRLPLSADWFRELSRYLGETKRSAGMLFHAAAESCGSSLEEADESCDLSLEEAEASAPRAKSAPKNAQAPEVRDFAHRHVVLHSARRRRNVGDVIGNAFKEILSDLRPIPKPREMPPADGVSLEDYLKRRRETFQHALLRLIDERGLTDPEVYKRANVDRKVFSKIRKDPDYQPKKGTALAFAIALRLDMEETGIFLKRAGYALSDSTADRIVEFFIRKNEFDIYTINCALFTFDQKLLPA